MEKNYGGVIKLDDVQKSKRGAEKTYDPDMLELLGLLADNDGVRFDSLVVSRDKCKDADEFRNKRQTLQAQVRSHVEHLVETKVLPAGTTVSINWHPELSVMQVTKKA